MRTKRCITMLRSGNRLVLDPTTPRVRRLLAPELTILQKDFAQGADRAYRKRNDLPLFDEVEWECFGDDHKGRLATSYGFHVRIAAVLRAAGYDTKLIWATKSERLKQEERARTVYKADWSRIDELLKSGFEFRPKQKLALKLIEKYDCGRLDCPPGWGKGTVIALAAMLYPKAKIAVVTKRVPILHTRLYPELCMNLPSVGIVGGGKRIKGCRVMCYTADSLHHARGDEDFVFVDEGHEACADDYAAQMAMFERARVWMFSASWDMRLDNKDKRAEAMAGPIRMKVTYQEAEAAGLVVPMEVRWTDVITDVNPCGDLDGVFKKKVGLWTHDYRNKLIAKDARRYGKDTQVLITVETLEHALELKTHLPEFKIVYSGQGMKESDVAWFRKAYPDQFKPMTPERKDKLTRLFSAGKIKKAIATTVWNVGVDFRHLEVLIRADGGSSAINDTQIPGRNTRPKKAADVAAGARKKVVGIIHDYRDQFDTGFATRAGRRKTNYETHGWKQVMPGKPGTKLRRMMHWGNK